jgi:hypothetical protein
MPAFIAFYAVKSGTVTLPQQKINGSGKVTVTGKARWQAL